MSPLSSHEQELQRAYNDFYAARISTDLLARLYQEALGDAFPAEVAAFGACDWDLLGTLAARLRLRPGQTLADIGCGTGGIGLWLARALAVELVGLDISSIAVQYAQQRRTKFVPAERARFQVGTVRATGLPDRSMDGVVLVDVPGREDDWKAALVEIHRVLAPGGRAVLTRSMPHSAATGTKWREQAEAYEFEIDHVDNRPEEPEIWRMLYRLWIERENDLRRELGDDETESMLQEANRVLPLLDSYRALVITLRRPAESAPLR